MFARSLLAISLGCLFSATAYTENTQPQTLPQISESLAIPIESYALTQASVESQAAPTTQAIHDDPFNHVEVAPVTTGEYTAQPETETAETSTPSSPTTENATQAVADWSLDALNNAEWSEDLTTGQFPVYARAQVLLDRQYASPGAIDGFIVLKNLENPERNRNNNTLKAISAYQTINNLPVTGELNEEIWQILKSKDSEPAFIEYTITEQDLKGPYLKSIPAAAAERAKLRGLYYTRVTEMLGEKFHMDENFLKKINPNADFNKVGEKIIVANVNKSLPEDVHLIIAHKSAKQLYLFNNKNQMIAVFPATVGKEGTPSPTGILKISNIAPNPWYSYNPTTFGLPPGEKYSIPPGPNNYVGNMWIGLSRPSFGIHGTPEPSNISKGTGSNGCVRLTNWDANILAKHVKVGVSVRFLE